MTTLRAGHSVDYYVSSGGAGGCAGAMAYYLKDGEPAGQWAGRGAERLGLSGEVDAQVIRNLYQEGISPDGEQLVRRRAARDIDAAERAAIRAFERKHGGYASATEVAEERTRERAKGEPQSRPYFDFTVNCVKSVSVLHASYRVGAVQARARGADGEAAELDGRADAVEQALMDGARDAVRWLEENAAYTRTGYHSSSTGEWRDGGGLTAALFLHHQSRDGDPHLHVHITVWNRVQRADGADGRWRTLYSRMLYQQRLGLQSVPDRFVEARLRDLGYVMVPRADGKGCEVGGVPQRAVDRFSSRKAAMSPQVAELAAEYERVHGRAPSERTLWLMRQQAAQNTRRTKAQARRTVAGQVHDAELSPAERFAAWERQQAVEETGVLSVLRGEAEQFARDHAPDGAGGAEYPFGLPPVPGRVLTDAERRKAARVAVAEVQKHHAAWTMAQLRFEVHRALGTGVSDANVAEVAALAVSGRCGADVVQVGAAPDIADVSELGVRASDGVSVYRPPGEARWTTVKHLDLEEHVMRRARDARRPRVLESVARRAVAGTDLNGEQAEAVVAWLTTGRMTVPVNAAPGSGKSHAVGVFARLWRELTGGTVIGLTTSTNAARVVQAEFDDAGAELAESYNIAEFLGKAEGSDELRYPVRVDEGDVLIVDEATQVSTADLAAVQQAAHAAGAYMHPVGDTEQLGAVEAGGMFAQLAADLGGPRLSEILRFRHAWERDAAVRLRAGDVGALAAYDRRGRIAGADREAIFDQAAAAWLSDHLRGRESLLLAGSSAEAADLARRVQARLAAMGRVGEGMVDLSDGNRAGRDDLVRARLNTEIDAGGRRLTNRDTLRIREVDPEGRVWAQRKTGRDAKTGRDCWTARFEVPREYLAANAELDYAGNVHVAQGRTVDAAHLAVTQTLSRQGFLVGMTRGRESNTAHVETGNTAPAGKRPFEQATPESVIAGVMERDAGELSATGQLRAGQEWSSGAGHVLHLWSESVRRDLYPEIDRRVCERLTAEQAARYRAEWAAEPFRQRLREAQLAGHDVGDLVDRVTADPLDGARSVASVLHSRLSGLGLDARRGVSWAQRTPDGASPLAGELAGGLDARQAELGARLAARPEPWVLRHLGQLAPDASPALRAEWERRAGTAAGYREAAGITDPHQNIAAEPHAGNPELETWRKAAMASLEIRDEAEIYGSMSRGELEALAEAGGRAVGAAPADVSGERRLAGRAAADAWAQAAQARAAGDGPAAAGAEALAARMEADGARLEPQVRAYEQWSVDTAPVRERAGKAAAELERRTPGAWPDAPPDPEPEAQPLADWWRDVSARPDPEPGSLADAEPEPAWDEASYRQEPEQTAPQSVVDPAAENESPEREKVPENMPADIPAPEPDPEPEEDPEPEPVEVIGVPLLDEPEPIHLPASPEPEPEPDSGASSEGAKEEVAGREARLDDLQAQAAEAADRIRADAEAQRESGEYVARAGAEADAGPSWQAGLEADELEPEA